MDFKPSNLIKQQLAKTKVSLKNPAKDAVNALKLRTKGIDQKSAGDVIKNAKTGIVRGPLNSMKNAREAASGLASGIKMHKPF